MCQHSNLYTTAHVDKRLNVIYYQYFINLDIRCSDCGVQFQFLGLPTGSYSETFKDVPTVSEDGCNARLPIEPKGHDSPEAAIAASNNENDW